MRRADLSVLWPATLVGGLIPALAAVYPVLRYDRVVSGHHVLSVWPLTPGITLGILLVGWLYVTGQRSTAGSANARHDSLRHLAFFGGLAALFLALQSPLEPISDHLFVAHQLEHMLLRTTAPALLMLAAPQAALLRGLPGWMRRHVVSPLGRTFHAVGVLGHPIVVTVLFVGTTYFWMIPRYHDLAILDERIHYVWHMTLLLSGLLFFWRIFDPRPYPRGASLGARLFMFWLASVGNILLGSYLSFKHQVLYHAYDEMGRLWSISAATDERFGGLTMWIPGSMMFAFAGMLMIYRWARQEERGLARSGDAGVTTAAEFRSRREAANRKMALGLLGFIVTVLTITLTTALIYHDPGGRGGIAAF